MHSNSRSQFLPKKGYWHICEKVNRLIYFMNSAPDLDHGPRYKLSQLFRVKLMFIPKWCCNHELKVFCAIKCDRDASWNCLDQ